MRKLHVASFCFPVLAASNFYTNTPGVLPYPCTARVQAIVEVPHPRYKVSVQQTVLSAIVFRKPIQRVELHLVGDEVEVFVALRNCMLHVGQGNMHEVRVQSDAQRLYLNTNAQVHG